MAALPGEADRETRIYFAGGASAVLIGWRPTTIDVDLKIVPDSDRILRAIPALKESLELNVELASPSDFIPEIPGWQERSRFIEKQGLVSFFHYDFYSQALAKIERGHEQDGLVSQGRRKDPSPGRVTLNLASGDLTPNVASGDLTPFS